MWFSSEFIGKKISGTEFTRLFKGIELFGVGDDLCHELDVKCTNISNLFDLIMSFGKRISRNLMFCCISVANVNHDLNKVNIIFSDKHVQVSHVKCYNITSVCKHIRDCIGNQNITRELLINTISGKNFRKRYLQDFYSKNGWFDVSKMGYELSGKDFNTYNNELIVKLTYENENHNGFIFKTGLNIDVNPFVPDCKCTSGGIYCTPVKHFHRWLSYNGKKCIYMRAVKIPNDARVCVDRYKLKADKIILGEKITIDDVITKMFSFEENESLNLELNNLFDCFKAIKKNEHDISKVLSLSKYANEIKQILEFKNTQYAQNIL